MKRFGISIQIHGSILFLLILMSISLVYGQDERPSWVDALPNRPDLFQAVGISGDTGDKDGDILRADNFAISQIIQEISITISTDIRQFYREDSRDGITETSQMFTYLSEQYAKETVSGIMVKARYYDKKSKNYYSYATLSRADLERQFKERADNAIKICQDYHQYGKEALQNKNVYDALRSYTKALNELLIVQASLKRRINGNLNKNGPDNVIQVQLENEMAAIVRNFEFRVTGGNNQKAERNQGLKEPLTGSVFYNGEQVPRIPLKLYFTNASGVISKHVITDDNGYFRAIVENIESSEAGMGQIKAVLYFPDIEPLKEEIPHLFHLIESNHALFTFKIDVAASVRIFVHIIEISDNEISSKMTATPALIRSLIENKYLVYDIKRLGGKISSDDLGWSIQYNDIHSITEALKNHVDYAIIGSLTIRPGDVSSGVLFFSYCDAEIKILHLESGRVVTNSIHTGIRGAGNSFETAGQRALLDASATIQKDILSELGNALK